MDADLSAAVERLRNETADAGYQGDLAHVLAALAEAQDAVEIVRLIEQLTPNSEPPGLATSLVLDRINDAPAATIVSGPLDRFAKRATRTEVADTLLDALRALATVPAAAGAVQEEG